MATSEVAPLAKSGGLADVSSALSQYLHRAGHAVKLLMPRYTTMDESQLHITPELRLQNLSMQIGPWDLDYSIDTTLLPGSDLRIYLLRCPALYDRGGIYTSGEDEHLRFIMLSRAAIEMCQRLQFAPDIFHVHDWHTSLIPLYLKTRYAWDRLFADTRTVLTIHNIGYQGVFPAQIVNDLGFDHERHELHQDDLNTGRVNFLKTGVLHADVITTVSPTYAREILGSEYGMGLESLLQARHSTLFGILNGVDYDEWNPETDRYLDYHYSADNLAGKAACKQILMQQLGLQYHPRRPLLGCVSRLTVQKGIDLMQQVLPSLLSRHDFAVAVLGSGEPRYEQFFQALQRRFPQRVCFYRGYNNRLAHMIEAGSDMFLMPSRYEPCGLNQMYSLRYGTVPIVRETGGLADSVEQINPKTGSGTGVVFRDYNQDALGWAIKSGLNLYTNERLWQRIIENGMAQDYSWDKQGRYYVKLFNAMG